MNIRDLPNFCLIYRARGNNETKIKTKTLRTSIYLANYGNLLSDDEHDNSRFIMLRQVEVIRQRLPTVEKLPHMTICLIQSISRHYVCRGIFAGLTASACTIHLWTKNLDLFIGSHDGKRWCSRNNGRYTNAIIPRSSNSAFEK